MKRGNRLRPAGLLLALLVLAAIVTGVAASAATTVIPLQLTGNWIRDNGVSMGVSRRGKVEIASYRAKFSRVTAHRLTVSGVPSCSGRGTYRWKFTNHQHASDQLKLTKIHDSCKVRVGLLPGNWLTGYPLP